MATTERLSRRKSHKISKGSQNTQSVDRISDLPDPILCHILSFLPTNFSVATSVLARRWRFVWTDVPIINLKNIYYIENGTPFSEIISRVLLLHNAKSLNTFQLRYVDWGMNPHDVPTDYQLETWIATFIARKLKNLDILVDNDVWLPRCLFTCKTLVSLTLRSAGLRVPWPCRVCFPILKRLRVYCVQFQCDESLPHLISGCPVLEELAVSYMWENDLVCCSISSPTLKWLKVEFSDYGGCDPNIHDYKMEINAPALRYLKVEDYFSEYISAQTLSSLIKADICLRNDIMVKENVVYSGRVVEFVERMCNVKCLKLSIGHTTKFLDTTFSASTTRFCNLTKLELSADWRFISKFLESADNLQVLIILKVDKGLKCWMEPQHVPICLLSHLRTIRIDQFQCAEHEIEMVRYLLRNAQLLKTMEITYSDCQTSDESEQFCVHQKISEFERGSEACQLALH